MQNRKRLFQGGINCMFCLCVIGFIAFSAIFLKMVVGRWDDDQNLQQQQESLEEMKQKAEKSDNVQHGKLVLPTAGVTTLLNNIIFDLPEDMGEIKTPEILNEYKLLYEQNQDMIGWLKIEETLIDYPVMQTMEDEDYYLNRNFAKEENVNGSLIMDTDAVIGNGTKIFDYQNGTAPSTNLIIHGHTMKSGQMFGNLKLYKDEDYGTKHNIIQFDSLYEHRKYELIAVFYSQVYFSREEVFKYYKFFQADNKAEFDDWYSNIKKLSLYETGVTAEYGDEFITLSCCSYHVEDGRFVVVGKRVA